MSRPRKSKTRLTNAKSENHLTSFSWHHRKKRLLAGGGFAALRRIRELERNTASTCEPQNCAGLVPLLTIPADDYSLNLASVYCRLHTFLGRMKHRTEQSHINLKMV